MGSKQRNKMGSHLGELKPHMHGQDERLEIYEMQQVKRVVSQAKPPPTKEACKLHLGGQNTFI